MFFLIFNNSNKKITKIPISEEKYKEHVFFDDSNIEDFYDVNDNIDVDKLNIYLEATDESWRAGDSNYKRLLDSLSPEDARNLIAGVEQYPKEITPVDIYGISLTVDDVLSDRYLEYLGLDSNSTDQFEDYSKIKDLDLLESNTQKSGMTGFSTLSFATDDGPNEYTDFDRKIGTNNQHCTTTSHLSNKFDYKYPYDPNVYFKTTNLPKFTCACIRNKNPRGYRYGFEICENGKTRSFTIDEFYEYLSEKTGKTITHITDDSSKLMMSCYPTKLKTYEIINSANLAKKYLDLAFEAGRYIPYNTTSQNLKLIGYPKDYFDDKTKEQIINFLDDQIENPHNYIFSCPANLNYPPEYKTEFELFFPNPPKDQGHCGSCSAFVTAGLLEGYIYNNYNKKLNLSEQYLVSQINNKGCVGTYIEKYLWNTTLNITGYLNKYLTPNRRIIGLDSLLLWKKIPVYNQLTKNGILKSKILFTIFQPKTFLYRLFHESTVPLGLPDITANPSKLKYEAMDACEFNSEEEYKNSAFKSISDVSKNYEEVCPNSADASKDKMSIIGYNELKNTNKYFSSNYYTLDFAKECHLRDTKSINAALMKLLQRTKSPIAISINVLPSFRNYKAGIWKPISLDATKSNEDTYLYDVIYRNRRGHGVLLYGWGTDEKTGQKYWMFRNSWGPDWGENGNFKVWMDYTTFDGESKYWDGVICDSQGHMIISVEAHGLSGELVEIKEKYLKDIENELLIPKYMTSINPGFIGINNVIKKIISLREDRTFSEKQNEYYKREHGQTKETSQIAPSESKESVFSSPLSKVKDLSQDNKTHTSNSDVLENNIYYSDYVLNQVCSPNSVVPKHILEGTCLRNDGRTGYTGSNFYLQNNLDKLLFSWNDYDILDNTCDYGNYYCDQDQLRLAMSKKINLLQDSASHLIVLGDLKFKPRCIDDICMVEQSEVSYPIKDLNDIFSINENKANTNQNQIQEKLISTIPQVYQKYIIITTTIDFDEELSESAVDQIISKITNNQYHKYVLNDRTYYQFRLIDYINYNQNLSKDNSDLNLKFLTKFSKNILVYYGNSLNSFLLVPKRFNSLRKNPDNKEISTYNLLMSEQPNTFMESTDIWKFSFSNNSSTKSIDGLGLYEISFENIDVKNKIVDYNITHIKDINLKNKEIEELLLTPINPSSISYMSSDSSVGGSVEYMIFDKYNDLFRKYNKEIKVIDKYDQDNWNQQKTGTILKFTAQNNNNFLDNLFFNKTKQVILYFEESENSKYSFNLYYINNKGESRLLEKNKATHYNNLYLFDYYPNNGYGQIQIVLNCDKSKDECPELYLVNAPLYKPKKTKDGYIYTIPDRITPEDDYANNIEDVFKAIFTGEVCVSKNAKEYNFWHNTEYQKYKNHYENIMPFIKPDIDLTSEQISKITTSDFESYYFEDLSPAVDGADLYMLSDNLLITKDNITNLKLNDSFVNNQPVYYVATDNITEQKISEIYSELESIITGDSEKYNLAKSNTIAIKTDTYAKNKLATLPTNKTIKINTEVDNSFLVFLQVVNEDGINKIKTTHLNIKKINNQSISDFAYNYELCKINQKLLCSNKVCDLSVNCQAHLSFDLKGYLDKNIILLDVITKKETEEVSEKQICPITQN